MIHEWSIRKRLMRLKQQPKFLPVKNRLLKEFYYTTHHDQPTIPPLSKASVHKKRKTLVTEGKDLSLIYPHSINLSPENAPKDFLLQTVTLPVDPSISKLISCHTKIILHFNNTGFLLFVQADEFIREYVFDMGHETFILLYAISSGQLDVYHQMTPCSVNLDVCIKPRCIFEVEDLPCKAVSQIQYQKINDFVTLLAADHTIPHNIPSHPHLLQFIYGKHSETQSEFVHLIKMLYDCCQCHNEEKRCIWASSDLLVQRESLNTQLRRYQIDAVRWMLYRESNPAVSKEEQLAHLLITALHPDPSRKPVFYLPFTGTFSSCLPKLNPPSLGGILADEMGLGKTLEVIALILCHPWPNWTVEGGQLYTLEGHVLDSDVAMMDAPTPPMCDSESPKYVLCSCGDVEETRNLELVQCTHCRGPWQHMACMQYNPDLYLDKLPKQHGYLCPQCWSRIRIESKATLIVAPDHIWQQWKEELQTHIAQGAIDVMVYAGMEAPVTPVELGTRGAQSAAADVLVNPFAPRTLVSASWGEDERELLPGFVQPAQLACADIVLTSYSVVQRELDWAEVMAERRAGLSDRPGLRLAPRYLCRPSPLTCVRWWRVCLDEAQMVERATSKTARMMSNIEARHRWCVTGTPAEKSIDDLFGLLAYLRYEPFSLPHYWNCMMYQPFLAATAPSWVESIGTPINPNVSPPSPTMDAVKSTLLAKALSPLLWRNTKLRINDQLALPPIREEIHWISFTAVERYIHDRVLAQSASALERLSRTMAISSDQPLANLPGATHWRLVYLITRLRQACTHASLVVATGSQSGRRRLPTNRQHTLTRGRRLGHGGSDEYGEHEGDFDECDAFQKSSCPDGPSVSAARAHRNVGTGCFTMTEVLRRVVDDTRRECENLLRSWVFNKNGAAGCFIIKQQYENAAECYREVLRTTGNLESRHGVLADWSQRLHAITNLNWLIQSRGVPLSDEPLPKLSAGDDQSTQTFVPLANLNESSVDPRVDRDLLAKAQLLRKSYIEMHSHLLAKVHDNLRPVVNALDGELNNDTLSDVDCAAHSKLPYGASWLSWFSDALQHLIEHGLGPNILEMLVASFQGKPGANRSFRTNLIHVGSVANFKGLLLTEIADLFVARKRLHEAMNPVMQTWEAFKAGKEADPDVLQPFYACCARRLEPPTEDLESSQTDSPKKKTKSKARELKQLADGQSQMANRAQPKKTRCAYCIALRALSNYQCALNHERLKSNYRTMAEQIDRLDTLDETDEVGTGLMMGNPLIVAVTIVCNQVTKLASHVGATDWPGSSKRFESLLRQMGREILLISRTLSLTKEWWNIHDDTEQFVVRLQTTSPADMAFIAPHEVDVQLESYIVQSHLVWPRLQSRLGHFGFLRNAHLEAVTGLDRKGEQDHTTFHLECPTCLQPHSPTNPTFVLLPGCWHTLCVPCHDRIASMGQASQRRCPVCRTPFQSNATAAGANARRRRPLTLIHYTGDKVVPMDQTAKKHDSGETDYLVVGDHSSKVQAVIRCLKQIKDEDPDAKVIVFSSWLSVLITIANALDQNQLSYCTLFQPRDACCPGRLTGFHCFGSMTWILLMPIQLGANGLNLTSANHVLLIDPVLSHGREAQAIARMHRIGQTRPCTVHRFLVRDSIEAALHAAHTRAQASTTDTNGPDLWNATDCMIGAGSRRSAATPSGVAGPGEDRAQLMQLTLGQLAELLHSESNSGMLSEELQWVAETDANMTG